MASPANTLTCAQCGFVNEPERVYCHNCGTKLDRSLLPREEDKEAKGSIEQTRKRVKKLTSPGVSPVKREIKAAIKTLVFSAVVAFVIQAVRVPVDVPSAKGDPGLVRNVGIELSDAVEAPIPRRVTFTEAEINAYLRSAARAKAGSSPIPGVKFERAFVQLNAGLCCINIQQSVYNYSLYSGIVYRLEVKNGQFYATQSGGNFGRVAISPVIMGYADIAFRNLWAALKRDHAQMQKMQAITIEKGQITLVTKGTR